MTYQEANRLVLTLNMNFASFLPRDIEEAAAKRGMWLAELQQYDFKKGLEAVNRLIQTTPYAPTIYDFKTALGVGGELTREDIQARLPGPTFESEEGMKALYTADPQHVADVFEKLMRE